MKTADRAQAAAIQAHMPMVERKARKLHARLPASVVLDDLVQAGRVAVWRALQSFDGRGDVGAHVAQRVGFALVDYLRETHPAGRNGPAVVHVNDDDLALLVADDDPAAEVQRAQEFEAVMGKFTPASRASIQRVLAGKPASGLGVSAAKVAAMLDGKRDKTPATFDPAAVPLHMGVPVPPAQRKRRNKFRELLELTPATGSCVLGNVQARSFISELKKAGIRYAARAMSPTTMQVWREPSPEQLGTTKGDHV